MTYEQLAVDVVKDYLTAQNQNPQQQVNLIQLWDTKAQSSGLSKDCPKFTFLGLCTSGYVKRIPKIIYTKPSGKNKLYGDTAVWILKNFSFFSPPKPIDLWDLVIQNLKAIGIKPATTHNNLMDIVLGLWKAGLIR